MMLFFRVLQLWLDCWKKMFFLQQIALQTMPGEELRLTTFSYLHKSSSIKVLQMQHLKQVKIHFQPCKGSA